MAVPSVMSKAGFSPDLSNLLLSGSRVPFVDPLHGLKKNRISSGQYSHRIRKGYFDENHQNSTMKKKPRENCEYSPTRLENSVNSIAQLEALKSELLRKYSAGSHSSSSQKSVPFRIEPLPEGLCQVYDNLNQRSRSCKSLSSKNSVKCAENSESIALLTMTGSSSKHTDDRVYERLDCGTPVEVSVSVTPDGEKIRLSNESDHDDVQFRNSASNIVTGLAINTEGPCERTDVKPIGSAKIISEIAEQIKQHHEKCKMKEESTKVIEGMGGPISNVSSVQNTDLNQKCKRSAKKRSGRRSRHRRKSSKARTSSHNNMPNLQSSNTAKLHRNHSATKAELNNIQAFCQPMKVLPLKNTLKAVDKNIERTFLSSVQTAQSVYAAPPNLSPSKSSIHKLSSLSLVSSEMQISASTNSLPAPQTIVERLKASMRKSWDTKTVAEDFGRVVKVFQSDKQSPNLNELGMDFPCAPPATPMPDTLRKYEIVPCMGDIRAQRAVKLRLEVMEKQEKKKLEKVREEKAKQEKVNLKEKEKETRKLQRMQIYALNKAMTNFEYQNFVNFCTTHGVKVPPK